MPHFEIIATETGADGLRVDDKGQLLLRSWVKVTVQIGREFDWERDSKALLRNLRKATELNEE